MLQAKDVPVRRLFTQSKQLLVRPAGKMLWSSYITRSAKRQSIFLFSCQNRSLMTFQNLLYPSLLKHYRHVSRSPTKKAPTFASKSAHKVDYPPRQSLSIPPSSPPRKQVHEVQKYSQSLQNTKIISLNNVSFITLKQFKLELTPLPTNICNSFHS